MQAKQDDLLITMINKYESAEQSTVDSRKAAERRRDYYDGKQTWDEAKMKKLRARGQPTIVVNRIGPKVDFLKGIEQRNRTDPKAYPRTPVHEQDADAATQALRYILDANAFSKIKSQSWEYLLIEGETACDIYVKPKGIKDGVMEYDVKLKGLSWDRIFVDPHCRMKDRSDATYLGQVVWMDLEAARQQWPDAEIIFEATLTRAGKSGDTYDDRPKERMWVDNKRQRIRLVDMWYLNGRDWYHCIFTQGGFVEEPKVSPYVNPETQETEHGMVFQAAYLDDDGSAYGVTARWMDLQDEINVRRSKALHLTNVRQARADKGAVDDVKRDIQEQLAKPDGVVQTHPGMNFEILPTGDMAASQFQLLQEAKQELDAVGANAAMTGQDERNMSGRALIARTESGMAELGPNFDALRDFELRVYRKVWHRVRQFWRAETWVRVTDDEKNVRFTGLNRMLPKWQIELEKAQAQGMQVSEEQAMQLQMQPDMQQMQVVNNIAELDVDIMIAEVPDTVSLQAEQFEQLAKLAQAGLPIPPDVLIMASGLRDKQKIVDKLQGKEDGMPAHVKAQIQQAMQQIQEAQQQIAKEQAQLLQEKVKLMQDRAKLIPEEIQVRHAEAQAEMETANSQKEAAVAKANADAYAAQQRMLGEQARASAEIEKARTESSVAQLEAMLSQITERLDSIGRGVPYMPGGSMKKIRIMTPTGQVYEGEVSH